MSYFVEQIKRADQTTSRWSGGTTTQLAIGPKDAVYADRKFSWRISSAVVEDETSEFTKLPGYWRYLMILEGELELQHNDEPARHLKRYDVDSFSGHWHTVSRGRVTDFNLMHNLDCAGGMKVVELAAEESRIIGVDYREMRDTYNLLTEAYYGTEGTTLLMLNDQVYELEVGDLILVTTDSLNLSFKVRPKVVDRPSAFVQVHILQR